MSLRLKTYILIFILSLISVLIARLYLEIIAGVYEYNHPQASLVSSMAITGSDPVDDLSGKVQLGSPPDMLDALISGSSHRPFPTSADEIYPYPAAASLAP